MQCKSFSNRFEIFFCCVPITPLNLNTTIYVTPEIDSNKPHHQKFETTAQSAGVTCNNHNSYNYA